MRYIKNLAVKVIVISMFLTFSVVPALATTTLELSEQLEEIEYTGNGTSYIDKQVENVKEDLLDMTYPVGSIYITSEDLSADDMADTFGGSWKRLKNTFLFASTEDIGETGGAQMHKLSAGIGNNDLSFVPYSEVFTAAPDFSLQGTLTQGSSFTGTVPVIEGTSRSINVMPPYTAVRMFKRVS